jgi:hypothetical protein
VDIPDRLCRQRLADVRLAPRAPAVVVAAALRSCGAPLGADVTRHDRGPALADDDEPFLGEDRQGMLQSGHRNVLQVVHLADRGERLTRGEDPGADRVPDCARCLLPGGQTAGGIDGEDRHVAVLSERLAGTRGIHAAPQRHSAARVDSYQMAWIWPGQQSRSS